MVEVEEANDDDGSEAGFNIDIFIVNGVAGVASCIMRKTVDSSIEKYFR